MLATHECQFDLILYLLHMEGSTRLPATRERRRNLVRELFYDLMDTSGCRRPSAFDGEKRLRDSDRDLWSRRRPWSTRCGE